MSFLIIVIVSVVAVVCASSNGDNSSSPRIRRYGSIVSPWAVMKFDEDEATKVLVQKYLESYSAPSSLDFIGGVEIRNPLFGNNFLSFHPVYDTGAEFNVAGVDVAHILALKSGGICSVSWGPGSTIDGFFSVIRVRFLEKEDDVLFCVVKGAFNVLSSEFARQWGLCYGDGKLSYCPMVCDPKETF